jgi:hypothetical protein
MFGLKSGDKSKIIRYGTNIAFGSYEYPGSEE